MRPCWVVTCHRRGEYLMVCHDNGVQSTGVIACSQHQYAMWVSLPLPPQPNTWTTI